MPSRPPSEVADAPAPEASPPLLRGELDAFAERYGMTTREYDILFLLISGHCSVSMIAQRLGLSRNTVHNHFKNVFRRTRTNSKAGVLALLIREALGRRSDVQPFVRRPRVLVIDHDGYAGPLLVESLQRRGMRVYLERGADRVLQRIAQLRIDALVVDTRLLRDQAPGLIELVQERYGKHPTVLLTTDEPSQSMADWKARGVGGLFERPVSADRLAFAILEHVVDSPYERSRLLRVDTDLRARINHASEARVTNLGFGGAFVAMASDSMSLVEKGSEIDIEIDIDDHTPVTLRGQVIWRSSRQRPSMPSGVGVRFVELLEPDRTRIEEFVRRRKLSDLSLAPIPARVA